MDKDLFPSIPSGNMNMTKKKHCQEKILERVQDQAASLLLEDGPKVGFHFKNLGEVRKSSEIDLIDFHPDSLLSQIQSFASGITHLNPLFFSNSSLILE